MGLFGKRVIKGRALNGIRKNGGGSSQFCLPSSSSRPETGEAREGGGGRPLPAVRGMAAAKKGGGASEVISPNSTIVQTTRPLNGQRRSINPTSWCDSHQEG